VTAPQGPVTEAELRAELARLRRRLNHVRILVNRFQPGLGIQHGIAVRNCLQQALVDDFAPPATPPVPGGERC